ncbi:MAG: DUF2442 domain-containing protein [Rhodospirillales bacterium]|jgi:DNA-binding XRE family transcriptional regulator|nr:hypothetical protein [Rhodospirillaceae bacterium]MDP6427003.1 DUF2442 domain-containing protein [Rhodospirillales bacterium]MDP6644635.1 DUF2442 domain-containing protein [Rhodospirillales bacterium]|tara:strand:- start:1810 stop:2337 length:528 start_codon:yes stop_codon:yes gene_type:complete
MVKDKIVGTDRRVPEITGLKVIPDYGLAIRLKGGGKATADLSGVVMKFAPFEALRDPDLFAQAEIISHGMAVGWPNGLDYSATSIINVAEAQQSMSGNEFIAWQERVGLSNAEAADALDVNRDTIKNYRRKKEKPVPYAIKISCDAMEKDKSLLLARVHARKPGRPKLASAAKSG